MSVRRLICLALGALPIVVPLNGLRAQDPDFKRRATEAVKLVPTTRAEVARERLEANAKRKELLEQRLSEIKQWTKAQFELSERGVIDKPKVMASILTRWQNQRENELHRLLQFRDKSAGGIESGKALNTMLDHIGPAANENAVARKVNPLYGLPLYEGTTGQIIDKRILGQLSYQENTLGAKATGKFNQDPIDVDWPAILRDERWAEERHAIEEVRSRLLEGLKAGRPASADQDKALQDSVRKLNEDYAAYRKSWIKNPPAVASRPEAYRQVCNGQRHIDKLIAAVYQVIEASSIKDVTPDEKFETGNIEDLLAYMHRNNLRFAPPSKNSDRRPYYQVFDLMVRYYLDVKTVTMAQQKIEDEIARIDQIDQDAIEAALVEKVVIDPLSIAERAALLRELNAQ